MGISSIHRVGKSVTHPTNVEKKDVFIVIISIKIEFACVCVYKLLYYHTLPCPRDLPIKLIDRTGGNIKIIGS